MSDSQVKTQSLYAKQQKIHAREVDGFFSRIGKSTALWLLTVYYALPWITWTGRQAVLFDLPARKFYIFGITLWPQDFIYLSWLLIMAALLLFLVTTVAGRLWCGYACPQTVWTKAFVWLERLALGNYSKRKKLDKAALSRSKVARKALRNFLWVSFAFWTGFTFVGYFTPIRELGSSLVAFELGGWETFWVCFYSFATLGNAGFLREQVCKYMCPYARFQSAMFDRNSLIIAYDTARGEPRGSHKRKKASEGKLGDCIDCSICVQVCPTGIDIREGLQYECIACAACVDACNTVMDKVGLEPNLIGYTTQNAIDGKPTHVMRPRTLVYTTLLSLLFITFLYSLFTRNPLSLDVIRDRNALYRELSDGRIENVYTLKVLNKSDETHELRIMAQGLEGLEVETDPANPVLSSGELVVIAARVKVIPEAVKAGGHDIVLTIEAKEDAGMQADRETRFFVPLD